MGMNTGDVEELVGEHNESKSLAVGGEVEEPLYKQNYSEHHMGDRKNKAHIKISP